MTRDNIFSQFSQISQFSQNVSGSKLPVVLTRMVVQLPCARTLSTELFLRNIRMSSGKIIADGIQCMMAN